MKALRTILFAAFASCAFGENPKVLGPFNAGRSYNAGSVYGFQGMGPVLGGSTNILLWKAPSFPVRKPDPAATLRGTLLRAEGGSTNAMLELAKMYRTGTGTETNEFEARVWEIRAGR